MTLLWLPDAAFLRLVLWRAASIWAGIRVLLFMLGFRQLVPVGAVLLVMLVVALTLRGSRRHGETIFLANLGVPSWHLAALAAIPPSVFELGVMVGW